MYENVHVLNQLLQMRFYVCCYIQNSHTESDIRSQWHLTDIAYMHCICDIRLCVYIVTITASRGRKGMRWFHPPLKFVC